MSVLLPEHAWASAGVNRDLETGMAWMFDRPQLLAILAGAAGGTMAIGGMEAFSIREAFPLFAIPSATSGPCRRSPSLHARWPAGGELCGPAPWAAAVAVGLAMVAMHLTGTFHPPAGIDPLVVVVNNMSWSFLIVPVGIGALLLATFAFAWNNFDARGANRGDTWPVRWW